MLSASRPALDCCAPPSPESSPYRASSSPWVEGPGRVLATHQLDDVSNGVVTSLGLDDEWVVVGLSTSAIEIYDATTGSHYRTLAGHELGVWCLTLVSRGRRPGARKCGSSVGGMGLGAGGITENSAQHAAACSSAEGYGEPGALIVSGGCDRDVRVWDVETGECRHVLKGHTSTIRGMQVLDGRPIAVSGSRDGSLRVWNIETGTNLHLLSGHEHSVRCIEVSGNRVVSGSYDTTCRLWDVDTGECLQVFRGHLHQIYAVAFDGSRVATGSLDSTVRVWSPNTGECLALIDGHSSLVGQVRLDPAANILVSAGSDGRIIVYDLIKAEIRHRIRAHDNSVTSVQFDNRFIISSGNDGQVKLWDFKTGAFIRAVAEHCEAVWRVAVRNDMLVTVSRKEGASILEVVDFSTCAIDPGCCRF